MLESMITIVGGEVRAELLYLVKNAGTVENLSRSNKFRPVFTLKQLIGVELTGAGTSVNPYSYK